MLQLCGILSEIFGHTSWKLLNMLQGLIQRTCLAVANTAQTLLMREKHAFNRALLKPKVRCHFPKPKEVKRINVHGWDTRMSTPEGRRVLMRRILKGRHDLSH